MPRTKQRKLPQLKRVKTNHSSDFGVYFSIYSTLNNWNVPQFHWDICEFLNDYTQWNDRTAVLQVFSSAAKSTITGCWIAWLLTCNPKLRVKIVSDTITIAEKMVRHCKSVLQQHPLSNHLLGQKGLEDTAKSFCVKGFSHHRDSSVSCGGVGVSMTGSRCDILIFDDVEASGNCLTVGSRESLNRTIGEANNLMDRPNNYNLFIGTPHSSDSIYPKEIKKGASSLYLPLLDNTSGDFPNIKGDSLWEAKIDNQEIKRLQKNSNGKGHFLSQYQLIPYSVQDTRFDVSKLNVYHNNVVYYNTIDQARAYVKIDDEKLELQSVNAFWDPALGTSGNDDSVLSIVYSDLKGRYFIDRTIALTGDINEQVKTVTDIALKYKLPSISFESNAIGAYLKELLIKSCEKHQIAVSAVHNQKRKADRLIEAFEARLSAGLIYIHDDVHKGKLTQQLMDFNPNTIDRDHNDYIDATASAILDAPIYLHYYSTNHLGHKTNYMFNPPEQFQMELISNL